MILLQLLPLFLRQNVLDVEDFFSFERDHSRVEFLDFVIQPARFVPLEIVLPICVASGFLRADVRSALLEVFSATDSPGGRRGFFHPDNFSFGQPLYLSQVLAVASEVAGVFSIDTSSSNIVFRRSDQNAKSPSDPTFGVIRVTSLEVIRADNDINQPQNGKITFLLQGGS